MGILWPLADFVRGATHVCQTSRRPKVIAILLGMTIGCASGEQDPITIPPPDSAKMELTSTEAEKIAIAEVAKRSHEKSDKFTAAAIQDNMDWSATVLPVGPTPVGSSITVRISQDGKILELIGGI
jgi:hypothetical protein